MAPMLARRRRETRRARVGETCEQRFDLGPYFLVTRTQLGDCRGALGVWPRQHRMPHAIDRRPAFRSHIITARAVSS
jgi:hypothetical protein